MIHEQIIPATSLVLSTITPVTTAPPQDSIVTTISHILQQIITPIPTPPITIEAPPVTSIVLDLLSTIAQRVLISVPAVIDEYLRSSLRDALQKVLQKHTKELIQQSSQKDVYEIIKIKQEHATKDKMPKSSATPYDQAVKAEFKQKEIIFKMMRESKSYEKHLNHKALYDALMLSLF
ncbi:hypothetical protein Tco_0072759 [Tanacetum coccineum]